MAEEKHNLNLKEGITPISQTDVILRLGDRICLGKGGFAEILTLTDVIVSFAR